MQIMSIELTAKSQKVFAAVTQWGSLPNPPPQHPPINRTISLSAQPVSLSESASQLLSSCTCPTQCLNMKCHAILFCVLALYLHQGQYIHLQAISVILFIRICCRFLFLKAKFQFYWHGPNYCCLCLPGCLCEENLTFKTSKPRRSQTLLTLCYAMLTVYSNNMICLNNI